MDEEHVGVDEVAPHQRLGQFSAAHDHQVLALSAHRFGLRDGGANLIEGERMHRRGRENENLDGLAENYQETPFMLYYPLSLVLTYVHIFVFIYLVYQREQR